jgi:collagenase-like PrtC family protease
MKLSVAYTFEPGIIPRLAEFPEVKELYGKLSRDIIGGGRSTITLRPTSRRYLAASVAEAHQHGLLFNYLINGAGLYGLEQTRHGQAAIRRHLDMLATMEVDAVTVASPYLLRLVKKQYPRFSVRVGVFALIDTPQKVRQWEDMGADTICVSAIACNRDFKKLEAMKKASRRELQLIVNASCLLNCAHEPTHMHLLTQSSMSRGGRRGFCLDYCILHCSSSRLKDPSLYMRATWIRPEDLHYYEEIGYGSFKIVERSCPADLLVKRVAAYAARSFDGNLLEIAGPVAQIKREQKTPLSQRMRMIAVMFKPWYVKVAALTAMKRYAEMVVLHDYDRATAPVYIDNKALDGFIEGLRGHDCPAGDCGRCGYCASWADKTVFVNETYRTETLDLAQKLDQGLVTSSLWLSPRMQDSIGAP